MSRASRIISSLTCVVLLSNMLGCATFHSPFAKQFPKASANNPVRQIECLWSPGEGHDPDGVPCKGFSGQILFFVGRSPTPVQVDGLIRVYLFDDQGTIEEQMKPLRQFDFSPGSWNVHLCESAYGPSYSVFVPYVRRGVSNARCSLRVGYRENREKSQIVFSDFKNIALDPTKPNIQRGEDAKPMQPDEAAISAMQDKLRRTTTISLSKNSKATELKPVVGIDPNVNPIQQASHEVPSAPLATGQVVPAGGPITVPGSQIMQALAQAPVASAPVPPNPIPGTESPEAARVRQLEAMVQQLLEQQQKMNTAPAPSRIRQFSPGVEPRTLDDEPQSTNVPERKPRTTHQLKAYFEDDDIQPAKPLRRQAKHPLDDDDEDSVTSTAEPMSSKVDATRAPIPGRTFGDTLSSDDELIADSDD